MPCCLFNSGQVLATPGALAALEAPGKSLSERHFAGDCGDMDDEDT